ncbi:MAG: metallophosphatase family protein [Bacteroidetes bacterium]|jgi:putative phosphoesterase|nr:metallophosphatase family protein [Bacteroidota bacterium]MDF1867582.1 metallophosphoesterase family protein [Saprospiraceae bacterium]
MKKIGLLSDTHGYLDKKVFEYFKDCDEIWHAGDIGSMEVVEQLEQFKPLKAVYGNIDDAKIRQSFPLNLRFECEGMDVFITHIGGYPGRYTGRVREIIRSKSPQLYICGHSHILKVMPDKKYDFLHINPGACGNYGFHKIKTIVRFDINKGKIQNLEVVELGLRGTSGPHM